MDNGYSSVQATIVMVDSGEKSVSSTAGHNLMVGHPYAEMRYFVAREHMEQLKEIMESGNVEAFGKILENEALSLHGLMMNSDPSFILMKPNTLNIIEKVRALRESESIQWYFTLDAGPNVHLMYPKSEADRAKKLIEEHLLPFTENNKVIYDEVGSGPEMIKE